MILWLIFVAIAIFFFFIFPRLGPKLVSLEYKDEVMTLNYANGSKEQYHGSCTVWTTYPDMRSVGLYEHTLYRYWKLCEHNDGKYEFNEGKEFKK